MSCESGSLDHGADDILDVCARWAGYGCECEMVEDADELGRDDDEDEELGSTCPVAWAMAVFIPDRVNGGVSTRVLGAFETGIGCGDGTGGGTAGTRGVGLSLDERDDEADADAVAAAAGFEVPLRPTQYRIN